MHKDGCAALPSVHSAVDNHLPTDTHRMNLLKPRHGGVDGKALSKWCRIRSSVNVLIAWHLVETDCLY